MLVCGAKSSHVVATEETQSYIDPKVATLVKIDDCGDVFADAVDTFAYDLLLFCQGLGLCKCQYTTFLQSICF